MELHTELGFQFLACLYENTGITIAVTMLSALVSMLVKVFEVKHDSGKLCCPAIAFIVFAFTVINLNIGTDGHMQTV